MCRSAADNGGTPKTCHDCHDPKWKREHNARRRQRYASLRDTWVGEEYRAKWREAWARRAEDSANAKVAAKESAREAASQAVETLGEAPAGVRVTPLKGAVVGSEEHNGVRTPIVGMVIKIVDGGRTLYAREYADGSIGLTTRTPNGDAPFGGISFLSSWVRDFLLFLGVRY